MYTLSLARMEPQGFPEKIWDCVGFSGQAFRHQSLTPARLFNKCFYKRKNVLSMHTSARFFIFLSTACLCVVGIAASLGARRRCLSCDDDGREHVEL